MTRPTSRKTLTCSDLLDSKLLTNFGSDNTPRSITGSVKKLNYEYQNARLCIFNRKNMSLLAVRNPDDHGSYIVNGLNSDLDLFIVAFDNERQYNAVIQDNVIPK